MLSSTIKSKTESRLEPLNVLIQSLEIKAMVLQRCIMFF